jgi:4-amino-4-deoxy-L-arabinose transferase-like glycosyltransferase
LFYEVFLDAPIPDAVTSGHHATALKTPMYPFFVWAVFACFGAGNFLALFLFHILISGITSVLIYLLLEPLSRLSAIVAASGYALYLPFVYHAVTSPESTMLMLLWIVWCLLLAVRITQRATNFRWILLGVAGACMTLTDPTSLPFFVMVLIYMGLASWKSGLSVRPAGVAFVVFLLLLTPWCLRNTFTFHQFVLLKTPVGQNFARGLQTANINLPKQELLALEKKGRNLNEAQEDQGIRALVWHEFSKAPARMLFAFPQNFFNFWWETSRYRGDTSWTYVLGRRVPYAALLILGLAAMVSALYNLIKAPKSFLENGTVQNLCLVLIVSYTAVFTAFGAWNLRYHFPAELALIVLGGLFLCTHERAIELREVLSRQFVN